MSSWARSSEGSASSFPRTIAINALSARVGGGVTYLRELIRHLPLVDERGEYYVVATERNRALVAGGEMDRVHVIEVGIRSVLHRLLYEQVALPFLLRRLAADVVYAPAEIAPLLARCPVVLGIQNSNPYYRTPSAHSASERARFWGLRQLARISAWKARRVVFVSRTALEDVSPRLGVSLEKARAIYHGVEIGKLGRAEGTGPTGLSAESYILCVATVAKHKNLETLIKAYAALDGQLQRRHPLVIAGARTSRYYEDLLKQIQELQPSGRVLFTGRIPPEDIPGLYRGAIAFVLPSYVEAFGIPLIEAMAYGVPVLASSSSAIPEVVGDAGLLFHPSSPDELCEKLGDVLREPRMRAELARKGLERAKTFSWEECARKTLDVLGEAFESKGRKR